MAQTKAQLLGPVVGDVVMDVSTLSLDAEGNKVGIGHSEPDLTLHVSGVDGLPSSSGSTPTGHLTLRDKATSTKGMFLGVSNASPYSSWIQAQDSADNSINYPLLLNPNGGNVILGTNTTYANDAANDLQIGQTSSSNSGITIGSSSQGQVAFADAGANRAGLINYNHGSDAMIFYTNGPSNERLRIKSDGQVNINASTESVGGRVVIKHNVDYTTTDFDDDPTLYLLNDDRTTGVSESAIVFAGRNNAGSTYRAAISGNGLTGLKFYSTSNTEADETPAMIINGSGLVGIGTNSPVRALDVRSGNSTDVVQFSNDSGNKVTFGVSSTQTSIDLLSSKSFRIRSGSDKRFDITTDGKVGINQTSPSEKLEVYGGDILLSGNANGVSGGIGPNAALKFEYNGHQYAKIVGNGRDSSGYGDIDFYTSSSAGVSNLTQRMTIRADGKVGIGTADPLQFFSVKGRMNVDHQGDYYGAWIDGDSNGTSSFNVGQWYNTGGKMYNDGNNLVIKTQNVVHDLLLQPAGGDIAIGNNSPEAKLHIRTASGTDTLGSNGSHLLFDVADDAGPGWIQRVWNSGSGSGGKDGSFALDRRYSGTWHNAITVTRSTGYVGIGVTSPTQKLMVKGVIATVATNSSNSWMGYTYTDNTFRLNYNGAGSDEVVITDGGFVGINRPSPQTELNVKGTISTGRNLAREVGTVIASSTNFNSYRDAENVLNGKKNYENGNNDWLTAGNNRNNANLTIDLGASYYVDRIVIYNQNEYADSRREVKQFHLEGSNDNSNWTLILDDELGRSNAHEPNPGWSFRLPPNYADDDEGHNYRYWKFHMKTFHGSDPYGGIMEIELYQASDKIDGEVTTHSLVASDVYTQTASVNRLSVGPGNGGQFTTHNEIAHIKGAIGSGQNTGDSTGNSTYHTGFRTYGYNPEGLQNRFQYTVDGYYARKSFGYYFPNGVSNQALRLHMPLSSWWSCGFITIHSTWSHQNAAGFLRYHFRHAANTTSNYGKQIAVDVNLGNTSGNFGMSDNYSFKNWGANGGTNNSGNAQDTHALELRHLTSTGNGCYIVVEMYGSYSYNYALNMYMTVGHTY